MKSIRFSPRVPADVRAIEQPKALAILQSLHSYAETGNGRVKNLSGQFAGLKRLRVGKYRVIFEETADAITVVRVAARKQAYR